MKMLNALWQLGRAKREGVYEKTRLLGHNDSAIGVVSAEVKKTLAEKNVPCGKSPRRSVTWSV